MQVSTPFNFIDAKKKDIDFNLYVSTILIFTLAISSVFESEK